MDEVNFGRVETVLEDVSYPISRSDARDEFAETTLLFADGKATLGDLVAQSDRERFDSADDLKSALHNVLPREAVGEPYQSEGEG